MQYLFIALFAFSLLCAGPVQAGESRGNLSNIKKPIDSTAAPPSACS